jgi:hypothetical protein
MIERLDEELVKELNQELVTVFGLVIEQHYEKYRGPWERIRSVVQNPTVVMSRVADVSGRRAP